jgi:GTP-binding protein
MDPAHIRNIAIIAHVDHGKTTLVDELFKQSGMYRDNQAVSERLMDSMDLEKERGITIAAKNGAFTYEGHLINIIDTPGHADFGGQVERVLQMADGALLLVDAQEGPMPQTFFVLKKALARHLRIVVVINKIDKPAARPAWVLDQVFDLFVKLNAPDEILDFPVIYSSAKLGFAVAEPTQRCDNMKYLYERILDCIPCPKGDAKAPPQLLVSSIDHNPFLGRLGIGKVTSGVLQVNKPILVVRRDGRHTPSRITKLYGFRGNQKVEIESAGIGEIVAVAGVEDIGIGETFTDILNPIPLPPTIIDPPTISMNFVPNDSPFAGREGQYVTSRNIYDRLTKERLVDVALQVEELTTEAGYKVSGRGELHLSILIEKMRREGFEFSVTRPQVIFMEDGDKLLEPYEELTVDVDEKYVGVVIEKLNQRRGQILELNTSNGMGRILYKIPTRGLLGYRSEFMSDTKGMGVMNYVFSEYGPHAGDFRNRRSGVLINKELGQTAGYSLYNLQDRGTLFLGPAEEVYEGQIVGENPRDSDMVVNTTKGKKLTNMRASGSDENIILTPPTRLTLEACIAFINDDELVEVTPKNIRLRKRVLNESERKRTR